MPETDVVETQAPDKTQAAEKKAVAGRGKIERAVFAPVTEEFTGTSFEGAPPPLAQVQNQNQENTENQTAEPQANAPETQEEGKPGISDEDVAAYLASKGIKFDGWDKLKEKAEYNPPTPELTKEEKEAQELATEKRMLDIWQARGGKVDDFVTVKTVAAADVAELSRSEAIRELKAEKFTDEEIDEILKARYFQFDIDSLEQGEDESREDFNARKEALEKRMKYGAKKLANRSSYLKTQAEQVLKGLKSELELEDAQRQEEAKFSAAVEDHFKKLERKQTIDLGKAKDLGDMEILPIEHDLSESSIKKAEALLKDPQKLKQFFYNQDGTHNLPALAELLVSKYDREEALKKVYLEALKRNTQVFHTTFPAQTAQAIGVGGPTQKNNLEKGRATGYGKPQRVMPSAIQ